MSAADSQLKLAAEKVATYKIKLYPPTLPNWSLTPDFIPITFEIITVKKQTQPIVFIDAVSCNWWPVDMRSPRGRPSTSIKGNAHEVMPLLQKALENEVFPYRVSGLKLKHILDAAGEAPHNKPDI